MRVNLAESPEFRALTERMLGALAGYPEALEAVLGELTHDVVDGHAVEVAEIGA